MGHACPLSHWLTREPLLAELAVRALKPRGDAVGVKACGQSGVAVLWAQADECPVRADRFGGRSVAKRLTL